MCEIRASRGDVTGFILHEVAEGTTYEGEIKGEVKTIDFFCFRIDLTFRV